MSRRLLEGRNIDLSPADANVRSTLLAAVHLPPLEGAHRLCLAAALLVVALLVGAMASHVCCWESERVSRESFEEN